MLSHVSSVLISGGKYSTTYFVSLSCVSGEKIDSVATVVVSCSAAYCLCGSEMTVIDGCSSCGSLNNKALGFGGKTIGTGKNKTESD